MQRALLDQCLGFFEHHLPDQVLFSVEIHDVFGRSWQMLQNHIANGDLPSAEPILQDFLGLLASGREEIEQRDRFVRERQQGLTAYRFSQLPPAQQEEFADAVRALATLSEPDFRERQLTAVEAATDTAKSDEERKVAQYESSGWFLRQYDLLRNHSSRLGLSPDRVDKIASSVQRIVDVFSKSGNG
jgi:hypothetical protein